MYEYICNNMYSRPTLHTCNCGYIVYVITYKLYMYSIQCREKLLTQMGKIKLGC